MHEGFVLKRRVRSSLPDDLIEAYREIAVANVSDTMQRLHGGGSHVRALHRSGRRMAGRALTVRVPAGDNLLVHKALDVAEPGDVVVIDAGGVTTNATLGELMIRYAERRGLAGLVIDGAVRDAGYIASQSFPVYARGVSHRGPYKNGPGEINVAIRIGDMVVSSGDLVLGDEDGVLAIAPAAARDIYERASAVQRYEEQVLRDIAGGTWDRSWVDESLRAKGCAFEDDDLAQGDAR